MILNTGSRTDIPAFYWDWFADKLFRGSCMIRNPQFPEKVSEYSLLPEDVDMFYFLSKNYGPALRHPRYPLLAVVQNYRCMFEYTITPYERDGFCLDNNNQQLRLGKSNTNCLMH